jgi:hypothetical protein
MALRHGSEANAKASPATAAEPATAQRCRSTLSCSTDSTTRPLAAARQTPESRFMRQATAPSGNWLHSQPSRV